MAKKKIGKIFQEAAFDAADAAIIAFGAIQSRQRLTPPIFAKIPVIGKDVAKNPEWGKIGIAITGLMGIEYFMPQKGKAQDYIHRAIKDALIGIGVDGFVTLLRKQFKSAPALAGGDYSMQYGRPIDMSVGKIAGRQNMYQGIGQGHGGVAPMQMQVGRNKIHGVVLPGMGRGVG